jgi:hypothetical protein
MIAGQVGVPHLVWKTARLAADAGTSKSVTKPCLFGGFLVTTAGGDGTAYVKVKDSADGGSTGTDLISQAEGSGATTGWLYDDNTSRYMANGLYVVTNLGASTAPHGTVYYLEL